MNRFLALVCLSFFAFQSQAQSDSISKNNYSFTFVNGISMTRFTRLTGSEKMENTTSVFHGLDFQYTRNFTPHFSLSGTAGFGFLPFNYRVSAKYSFSGSDSGGDFDNVQYQVFGNLALSAGYRRKISPKYAFKVHAGVGMKLLPAAYFTFESLDWGVGENYHIQGEFKEQANPYITVGAAIIRTLRNKDEFALRLSYEQFFREVYKGEYRLYNNTSTGRFYNTGSNFNLGLTYTFTGEAKKERLDRLRETDFPDKRAAKKQYKKEIRYIDPKSMFITASAGLGFGINRVKDPGKNLKSGTFESFLPRVTFEKGIARNYFAEAGFNTLEFWSVLKLKLLSVASGSNAFYSYQLSVGGGKRLITKNNYNVLTLHAGLTFGLTDIMKGYNGSSNYFFGTVDDAGQPVTFFTANGQEYGLHKFITSAYLGASKDFRVTKGLYLSFSYRYQQGFYTIYEQRVQYLKQNSQAFEYATIKVDGSSHVFEFGLKVKL